MMTDDIPICHIDSNTYPATVVMTVASSLPKSLRYHNNILDISTALLSSVSRTCKKSHFSCDIQYWAPLYGSLQVW